jgi:hypothetical protein
MTPATPYGFWIAAYSRSQIMQAVYKVSVLIPEQPVLPVGIIRVEGGCRFLLLLLQEQA